LSTISQTRFTVNGFADSCNVKHPHLISSEIHVELFMELFQFEVHHTPTPTPTPENLNLGTNCNKWSRGAYLAEHDGAGRWRSPETGGRICQSTAVTAFKRERKCRRRGLQSRRLEVCGQRRQSRVEGARWPEFAGGVGDRCSPALGANEGLGDWR